MKNLIQKKISILSFLLFFAGCSAEIPPYDKSVTWERVPAPKSGGDFSILEIVYIDANNDLYAVKNDTLWYSANIGENWAYIQSPLGFQYYRSYQIYHNGIIYILDENIIHRTTNRGTSWTQHPIPYSYDFLINPSGHLFLRMEYDWYRSTDMGNSWHQVSVPRDHNNYVYRVFMANNGDLTCFASPNIFYSTNDGLNWDTIPSPEIKLAYVNSAQDIILNGSGTLRSTDLGLNWIDMHFPLAMSDVLWVNGTLSLISGPGGVYRWLGDGNWSQVNSGLPEPRVNVLNIDTSGIVYANTSKGAYRSKHSIYELE